MGTLQTAAVHYEKGRHDNPVLDVVVLSAVSILPNRNALTL